MLVNNVETIEPIGLIFVPRYTIGIFPVLYLTLFEDGVFYSGVMLFKKAVWWQIRGGGGGAKPQDDPEGVNTPFIQGFHIINRILKCFILIHLFIQ